VTSQDISRAKYIYDPSVAMLKGKSRRARGENSDMEYIPRMMESIIHLHVDVMFFDGLCFLVSVGMSMALAQVTYLGHNRHKIRSVEKLRKALQGHICELTAANFTVTHVSTDGEKGLVVSVPDLSTVGVTVKTVAAGQHVPIVENKIRSLKETIQSIIHSFIILQNPTTVQDMGGSIFSLCHQLYSE
jgi:hypothetical protein